MRIVTWNVLEHTAIKYQTLNTPVFCRGSNCRKPEPDTNQVFEKNYRDRYRDIATFLQAEIAQENIEIICLQEAHFNLYEILKKSGGLLGLGGLSREYHMYHDAGSNLLTLIRKKTFTKIDDMSRKICPIDMPLEIKLQAFYLITKDTKDTNNIKDTKDTGFYVVNTHLPGKPGPDGDNLRVKMVNRIVNSLKLCHEKKRAGEKFSMLMVGDMNQPDAVSFFGNNVALIKNGLLHIPQMDPNIATSYHRFELIGDDVWRQKNYNERYEQIDYLIHSSDWMLDGKKGEVTPASGMYGHETPYKVEDIVDLELYLNQGGKKPTFVDNFDISRGKGWLSDHALIKYTLRKKLDRERLTNSAEATEFKPIGGGFFN